MRRLISASFVLLLLVATAGAQAGKPINAKCPIKGEPAKPDLTTTYKGVTIGFC
ncbi:MAG: hypothetical protein HY293_18220 [Planctomycetes bacterium]|nr:hypothetical protein [Planctomycetota bacterium]